MRNRMNYMKLINMAYDATKFSYAPYSKFKVGAVVVTEDEKLYTGCNVENSSYGATVCAERTAALKAISEGYTKFKAIVIVSESKKFTYPCGICRQFLSEFMSDDAEVILHCYDNDENQMKIYKFSELLPEAFKL